MKVQEEEGRGPFWCAHGVEDDKGEMPSIPGRRDMKDQDSTRDQTQLPGMHKAQSLSDFTRLTVSQI